MKHPSTRAWLGVHVGLTVAWVLLVVPTLLWWRDSILWVAFMSLWANAASHGAAAMAARGALEGERARSKRRVYREPRLLPTRRLGAARGVTGASRQFPPRTNTSGPPHGRSR